MSATLDELAEFQQFAAEQLRNGGAALSLEELLERWRGQRPTDDELAESLASLQRGLADIEAGRVFPARTVIQELGHGLPDSLDP